MCTQQFPIGFWNYTRTGDLPLSAVQDWSRLGMTFATSPGFNESCDKNEMIALLDECHREGIRVIICDQRVYWHGASDDPVAYEARFRRSYEDFGSHPAVIGFHIGDEPLQAKQFADCIAAHSIQRSVAPELTPHLNFHPFYSGIEEVLKVPDFAPWLLDMVKKIGVDIVCYDCYSQMINDDGWGVNLYYENLRHFYEAAKATGTRPWSTLLSVGHFRFRCPSEDDLRWQLNTAVASGMQGIMWFFLYMRAPISNYRLAPIDEFGEKTETFHWLSRVNRHFLHQFGNFFTEATHLATYHLGHAWGGYPLFEAGKTDPAVLDVTCDHGLDAVLGFFEKDGQKYLALVNNSWTESGEFKIHVPKGTDHFARLNWHGEWESMKEFPHDAFYEETECTCIGGDWLAPGQMKVYRV